MLKIIVRVLGVLFAAGLTAVAIRLRGERNDAIMGRDASREAAKETRDRLAAKLVRAEENCDRALKTEAALQERLSLRQAELANAITAKGKTDAESSEWEEKVSSLEVIAHSLHETVGNHCASIKTLEKESDALQNRVKEWREKCEAAERALQTASLPNDEGEQAMEAAGRRAASRKKTAKKKAARKVKTSARG